MATQSCLLPLFAHQIGLPVPGPLFLLAAGALAAAGKLGLVSALGLAVTACVLADWLWYEAGRAWGDKVLHFIHCFARDPDVARSQSERDLCPIWGSASRAGQVRPGLDAVVPPLAGTSRTSRFRFLALRQLAPASVQPRYAGLGYVFSHDLTAQLPTLAEREHFWRVSCWLDSSFTPIRKLVRWRRLRGNSRVARITQADSDGMWARSPTLGNR